MKIYHFTLLFAIFFFIAVVLIDISIGQLKSIETQKAEMTRNLDTAASDAVEYLATTGTYGTGNIKKEEVVARFFASLYSAMGIISDIRAQAEIEMYIPVILLCDIDGFYVNYYDEYVSIDGGTYSERVWSEKLPYSYEDEEFIYRFSLIDTLWIYDDANRIGRDNKVIHVSHKEIMTDQAYSKFRLNNKSNFLIDEETFELVRKGAIINNLEVAMAYYTSRHNAIARRNGITYTYSFPAGKGEEWGHHIDDVNIIVVFQGYPYGGDRNFIYNKVASAGANIIRKPLYYIEEKSWYRLAHMEGCERLGSSTVLMEEVFESIGACAQLGAYACECIEHGARVPRLGRGTVDR